MPQFLDLVYAQSTADTTGPGSGSVQVAGGAYVAKSLYVAGTMPSTSSTTGALVVPNGGLGVGGDVYAGGGVYATKFARTGGTASQFLKADGTVDTTAYISLASPITGYVVGSNAALTATDSVVAALGKLQAQVSSVVSGRVASFNTRTGPVTLTAADVTTALGYTPVNKAGDSLSGVCGIATAPNTATHEILRLRDTTATGTNTSVGGLLLNSAHGTDFLLGKQSANAVGSFVINTETGTNLLSLSDAGDLAVTGIVTASGFVSSRKILDLSALNSSTYYPVTIVVPTWHLVRMRVEVALNTAPVPTWATHSSGFTCLCDWSVNGSGWGTVPVTRIVHVFTYSFCSNNVSPVAGIAQFANSSNECIWLRGGGVYVFESDYPVYPVLRTSDYTTASETISPTTSILNNVWSMSTAYFAGSGAGLTGTAPSLTAGAVSSITGNTGLIRDRLTPPSAQMIDSVTTSNFRTTVFGGPAAGSVISTARWNTTPALLSGLTSYGTMMAWGASDTHGFLAINYDSAGAIIGGGNGNQVNWTASLITSANISSQSVNYASTVGSITGTQVFNAINGSNNTDWYRTTGSCGIFFSSYSTGLWATSTQWLETYNNGNLRVNGELRATGNITAYYSDQRLKENIKLIEGALDKVLALRGVTFNANQKALEVGYTDTSEQVGVIAQEVQKVLPQAVKFAPFDQEVSEDGTTFTSKSGENYLTVQYERLAPLLIEAIKELNAKIEAKR